MPVLLILLLTLAGSLVPRLAAAEHGGLHTYTLTRWQADTLTIPARSLAEARAALTRWDATLAHRGAPETGTWDQTTAWIDPDAVDGGGLPDAHPLLTCEEAITALLTATAPHQEACACQP